MTGEPHGRRSYEDIEKEMLQPAHELLAFYLKGGAR